MSMEDYTLFQEWLTRLKYKEGWKFMVTPLGAYSSGVNYCLTIELEVEDTYNPGKRITLNSNHSFSSLRMVNFRDFVRFWRDSIHWRELHEADEWMRVDGQMEFDPHNPIKQVLFFEGSHTHA